MALDVTARQPQRIPLRVDPAVALTRLRRIPGEGPPRFVAFADLGPGLYVFDPQWQTLGEFSAAPHLLTDVQVYSSPEGPSELVIVDNAQHVRRVNADTLQVTREATVEFASGLVAIPSGATWPQPEWHSLVLRADGSCAALTARLEIAHEFRVPELRLVRVGLASGSALAALGLALDRRGDWVAVGIDREFQVAWTQPIGTQAFDWQIEPLAHQLAGDRDFWAIAGSDATVTVLDDRGRVHQRWQCGEPIHGIAWSPPASAVAGQASVQANLAISLDTRIVFANVPLDSAD